MIYNYCPMKKLKNIFKLITLNLQMNQLPHYSIANQTIETLKKLDGLSKIVLYGSVSTNTVKENSDIDLAIILEEELRLYSFYIEPDSGIPFSIMAQAQNLIKDIRIKSKINIQLGFYFQDEWDNGIEIYSGRKFPADKLNEVGVIKYEKNEIN